MLKKKHRLFFAVLLAFYSGLGLLTAVILKPIVKETRAYMDYFPSSRSIMSDIPIGYINRDQDAPVIPADNTPATPAAAPASDRADAAAEASPDESAVPAPDAVAEEPAPADTQRKYYSFVTINVEQILYVRTQPGLDKKSIARLKPGTKGYVLQEGPNWCYILAGDIIGFSSTEYLELTEVPKEQFPQEYLDIVSPFSLDVPNR